jgi:hypothetical protein
MQGTLIATDSKHKTAQSLQSEPSGCNRANGRNPEQGRVAKTALQSAW